VSGLSGAGASTRPRGTAVWASDARVSWRRYSNGCVVQPAEAWLSCCELVSASGPARAAAARATRIRARSCSRFEPEHAAERPAHGYEHGQVQRAGLDEPVSGAATGTAAAHAAADDDEPDAAATAADEVHHPY